jgi:hypothetical protein
MRKALMLTFLLAAGCGGAGNEGDEARSTREDLQTFDVSEDRAGAPPPPPGIAPSAAPGVAFNYRYAFRLPADRISRVQEQHAQMCERLGLSRCRITGMLYRVVNEGDIEGRLAFKLDPAIARAFGKQGADAVTSADGMLVESEITGEDVGSEIESATRNEGQLTDELRRIEGQLARSGLGAAERAQLQLQAQQIRDQIRASSAGRQERQQMLATTPVTFIYGSGDLVPGFDTHRPFRDAVRRASENFVGGLAWLLVLVVTLLPWAAAAALGYWLWRRFWPRRRGAAAADQAPPGGTNTPG